MLWDLTDDNIGSVNGSVPSGNKPLREATLTKTFDAIWCHEATI